MGSRTRGCNQVISLSVGIVGNEQKPEIVLEQEDDTSGSQEPGPAPKSADFGASLPGFPSFSPVTCDKSQPKVSVVAKNMEIIMVATS